MKHEFTYNNLIRERLLKKKEKISEEKLVLFAKQDRRNFKYLYEAYYERIFLFLLRRSENENLAQDLTQQTFVKAMLNIEKFEFKGFPFSSWLYRIGLNELNLYYRSNKKKRTISIDNDELPELVEELPSESNPNLSNENLIKAFNFLSEAEVTLVEMKYFEKRSHQEISEILGISVANAKVKLHRVIKKMKNKIIESSENK
ncbi:MAG: RNA polymerase [Flavobacteriales bacterium]|nr:RNA polymerase [Flavobacteriales bacterium]MBO72251.1 RNA polymerase [Flavobacteriales bacterium]